jgi:large repetitive protein
MNLKALKVTLALSALAFVAGCGGGSDNCGGSTLSLFVSYPTAALKLGANTTVTPNFSPESCRGDATFTQRTGAVPTGMVFNSNGTITGTPTATGTFSISYSVAVKNYSSSGATANANFTVVP